MKFLIPIFLCFSFVSLKSQHIWIKGYGGLGLEPRLQLNNDLEPRRYVNSNNHSSAVFAMPAIVFELTNGNFGELGFKWENRNNPNEFSIIKVPPLDSIKFMDLGATKYKSFQAGIDFNFPVNRNVEKRWQSYIGLGINPHWSRFDFITHQSFIYPVNGELMGVNWGVIPRFQYKSTDKLLIDFNVAVFLLSTNYEFTQVENPSLTFNQQRNGVVDFDFLKQVWLRVGLAWKIWGKEIKPHEVF